MSPGKRHVALSSPASSPTARCRSCGIEADEQSEFSRLEVTRRICWKYCPKCTARWQSACSLVCFVASLSALVAAVGLLSRDPRRPLGLALLSAGSMVPALAIACLIHELGHALLGRLVGLSIYHIALNAGGAVLFRRRFRNLEFVCSTAPFGGYTLAAPRPGHWQRLRIVGFVLGGCLANIAVIALFATVWSKVNSAMFRALLAPQIVMNLFLLVNLVPFRTRRRDLGPLDSDGLQLLTWPFRSADRLHEIQLSHLWLDGDAALHRNELGTAEICFQKLLAASPGLRNGLVGLAQVAFQRGKLSMARGYLIPAQFASPIPKNSIDEVDWRLALIDLLLFQKDLLPEADQLSERAFRRAPWNPEVQATRGAVLAMIGRTADGVTMIEQSLCDVQGGDRVLPLSLLAVARWRTGDHPGASAAFDLAKRANPHSTLLPRIQYQLGEPVPGDAEQPD